MCFEYILIKFYLNGKLIKLQRGKKKKKFLRDFNFIQFLKDILDSSTIVNSI